MERVRLGVTARGGEVLVMLRPRLGDMAFPLGELTIAGDNSGVRAMALSTT